MPSSSTGFWGCDHEEGTGHGHGLTFDGELALLHGLEQGCLGTRRGAVDLVGEHELGQQGAGAKLELARLLVVDVDAGDVRGQQVGG